MAQQYTSRLAAVRASRHAVLWCNSHCPTGSQREKYVGELLKHINITTCASKAPAKDSFAVDQIHCLSTTCGTCVRDSCFRCSGIQHMILYP